jgi:uncharacterized membrane protein
MDSSHQQSKEPVWALAAGPYGHPFHPILVTIPLGAWVSSLVFDVASHLVAQPQVLATGALWLLGIGVLGALAAASVGTLDLLAIPAGTQARRTAVTHALLNLTATVIFACGFAWRFSGRDQLTATPVGQLALSVTGLVALTAAGYLGGKLAYHFGVRVASEDVQAEGFVRAEDRSVNRPTP